MTELLLVARVASASSPGSAHEVRTDGAQLTCACPGWTRRTHTRACAAHSGRPCSCGTSLDEKATRTCRHTRAVQTRVDSAGGLAAVVRMIRAGSNPMRADTQVMEGAPPQPAAPFNEYVPRGRTRRRTLARNALPRNVVSPADATVARLLAGGLPDRVLTDPSGQGIAPRRVPGLVLAVVFVRADGWSLGASWDLAAAACRLYANECVDTVDVRERLTPRRFPGPVRRWSGVPCRQEGCAGMHMDREAEFCEEHRPRRERGPLYVIAESDGGARRFMERELPWLRVDRDWYPATTYRARGVGRNGRYLCVEGFWRSRDGVQVMEMFRAHEATEVRVPDLIAERDRVVPPATPRRRTPPVVVETPAAATEVPSWVGGGRAILLRE